MTTYCPYCGAEMTSQFSETNDLYYVEGDERTYWDISELWACFGCPGPEEE